MPGKFVRCEWERREIRIKIHDIRVEIRAIRLDKLERVLERTMSDNRGLERDDAR